jgi:hypothetical protein
MIGHSIGYGPVVYLHDTESHITTVTVALKDIYYTLILCVDLIVLFRFSPSSLDIVG